MTMSSRRPTLPKLGRAALHVSPGALAPPSVDYDIDSGGERGRVPIVLAFGVATPVTGLGMPHCAAMVSSNVVLHGAVVADEEGSPAAK